jgi:hypothetical protein
MYAASTVSTEHPEEAGCCCTCHQGHCRRSTYCRTGS